MEASNLHRIRVARISGNDPPHQDDLLALVGDDVDVHQPEEVVPSIRVRVVDARHLERRLVVNRHPSAIPSF
jgi:hypothetical protein